MIVVQGYEDLQVAVYGLGRTGLAAIRSCLAGGARVICWDDDPNRREAGTDLGAHALEPNPTTWADVKALILSPGVPLTHPEPHPVVRLAQEIGAEIVGDTELFARSHPQAPIIAVTGTNGKSTTTALIAHLLNSCGRPCLAGGNIGQSVLDFEALPADEAYVVELSSYQIDLTEGLRPAVTVLLNITPDHLDRHGGMAGYVAAKRRLFDMAGPQARHVIGVDDDYGRVIASALELKGAKVARISVKSKLDDGFYAADEKIFRAQDGIVHEVADLTGIETLRGAHNWQNAAAALAVMDAMGFDPVIVAGTLASFAGLPHRMELAAVINSVRFVNDSKATNGIATAQALAAYDNIYWILGGIAKQGGIEELHPYFSKIRHAYLIGEAAPQFADMLGTQVPHSQCGTLEKAVRLAHEHSARDGSGEPVVLLSPACASFDQFDSFEARGSAFCQLVQALQTPPHLDDLPSVAGGAL